MPYYRITVQRGHQGSGQYIPITFIFKADDIVEAIEKAKKMPGVKHNKPIIAAEKLCDEGYYGLSIRSAYIDDFVNDIEALKKEKEN